MSQVEASPNPHNLEWAYDADGVANRQGWRGPVAVDGAFKVIVAQLAAYGAGVGG